MISHVCEVVDDTCNQGSIKNNLMDKVALTSNPEITCWYWGNRMLVK